MNNYKQAVQKGREELMKLTEYYDYKRRFKPTLFGYIEGANYERRITQTLQDIRLAVIEDVSNKER